MNTTAYWMCVLAAAAVCLIWLPIRLKMRNMRLWPAALGLVLAGALAGALAKVFYVLLMYQRTLAVNGAESFWDFQYDRFSFFGGCVGAVLGMALAAKIAKENAGRFLDAFAPVGAAMAAVMRFGEYYLGMLGASKYDTESAFLCRFPFAVSNEWDEWYLAVFMLEALCALVIALIFTLKKKDGFPMERLLRVAYYLCVAQIFCESVRMMGMRWGFVRAEQLLSGVGIFFILLYVCVKTPGLPFLKRFWPLFGALACIGGLVGVEFALDRTEIPDVYWYGVMLLILIVFGLLEGFCVRRRMRLSKA